ncbi:hypothetical protein DENSPDRAFT_886156 [Dentipellis sp. KUC8613]|nr:hypothetical protein DENSPDRAFT_886156 [Dentipellis sp. KUC8613]
MPLRHPRDALASPRCPLPTLARRPCAPPRDTPALPLHALVSLRRCMPLSRRPRNAVRHPHAAAATPLAPHPCAPLAALRRRRALPRTTLPCAPMPPSRPSAAFVPPSCNALLGIQDLFDFIFFLALN